MVGAGPFAMTFDEGIRQSRSLKPFVVFVSFVVKSPFTGLGEGKGVIYHEGHEEHEEGKGGWVRGSGKQFGRAAVS